MAPLTPAWVLTWSIAHSIDFPRQRNERDVEAATEELDIDEEKVGIAITSMRCVLWQSAAEKAPTHEWSVIIGDDIGRVSIFDISKVAELLVIVYINVIADVS